MRERKPEDALRDWSRSVVPGETPEVAERRRDRVVSQIARQIALTAEHGRRRKQARGVVAAFLIAAAAALVAVISHRAQTLESPAEHAQIAAGNSVGELRGTADVSIYRQGAPLSASEGVGLAAGDEVRTGSRGRSDLRIAGGAVVSIEPQSRVSVDRPQAIEVAQGEVGVSVPKLVGAAIFLVRTPDAKVVVHGTRFVVSVGAVTERPRTRVRVLEGRVSVLYEGRESVVAAGQSWPAVELVPKGAAETSTAPVTAPGAGEQAGAGAKPVSTPSGAVASRLDARAALALAEQNRIFSAAVAARRRGDEKTALARLDELLSKHPTAQLAPEARVERFRALKRLGRDSEAAREASRYLLEHESGAAREEAREVVLPGSPER